MQHTAENTKLHNLLLQIKQRPSIQIISANARIARFVDQAYLKAFQSLPQNPSLSLKAFYEKLWVTVCQAHEPSFFFADAHFSHQVWKQIIKENSTELILRLDDLADLCAEADHWVQLWNVEPWLAHTREHHCFLNWQRSFHEKLNFYSATSTEQILKYLPDRLGKDSRLLPRHLILIGFYEQTPYWKKFWKLCQESGVCVETMNFVRETTALQVHACLDFKRERTLCANWLKSLLDDSTVLADPAPIGIVVPNLERTRNLWFETITEVISSDFVNLSAPPNLLSYPLINAAHELIGCLSKPYWTVKLFSKLLKMPYWKGFQAESHDWIQFELYLKTRQKSEYSLENLKHLLEQCCQSHKLKVPCLQQFLDELIAFKNNCLERQKTNKILDWLQSIQTLLNRLGWPKETPLSSLEHQLHFAWNQVLIHCSKWSSVLGNVTYFTMLEHLGGVLNAQHFLPEQEDPKVQVLGVLEAIGLPFSRTWLADFDGSTWPSSPQPNPFIPYEVQRKYQLPRSSLEREWDVANAMTHLLVSRSSITHVSYVTKTPEGCEQALSPLLLSYPHVVVATPEPFVLPPEKPELECYSDDCGEPWREDKLPTAYVLQAQSDCHFKGYALGRFKPVFLEDFMSEKSWVMDRGRFLHRAFWWFIQTQQNMAKTLGHLRQEYQHEDRWREPILSLELKRVEILLKKWMHYEQVLLGFETQSLETVFTKPWGGHYFHIRPDRLIAQDQQRDGPLIIDYKSGRIDKNWHLAEGPRLESVQLALYSTLHPHTAGLCLVGLYAGEISIAGFVSEALDASTSRHLSEHWGLKIYDEASLRGKFQSWQAALDQIIVKYIQGEASLNPKQGTQTCRWCSLSSLCRITL